ncbi:MAG TPA: cation diffusion facilitator family transporter [Syntrophorhabdaceae bacterium]|nr:cation diffusion facilitator family transporter [Syntrophorhabdaceae bacterium]HQM81466.1 cation diffusion facilitator family transporter [Syntrophorhabdaceae bacterium]
MDIRQKASITAISLASILASSKFIIGFTSGSMAVVSSGLDSLLDAFMSLMNLFAVRKASQPADDSHQYGHGKVEDMAQVIQALVIVISGVLIISRSVRYCLRNEVITYSFLDASIMVLSLAFTFAITAILNNIAEKTDSNTLRADALHYKSDIYSNTGAIIAITLAFYTGRTFFDLLFAVITGCIIIYSAMHILKSGLYGLMDASIPKRMQETIEKIIGRLPYPYAGYHKLRTRFSGNKKYIDFHLLICKKLNIDEAHELANKLEKTIKEKVLIADIVIHVEPCDLGGCKLTEETCTVRRPKAVAKK